MGDLLLREPGPLELIFSATGLRSGQSIRLIRDGVAVGEYPSEAPEWSRRAGLEIDGPTFVRLEVLEAGERVALSNPLYVELRPEKATEAP